MPTGLNKAQNQSQYFKFDAASMTFDDAEGYIEGYLSVFGNDDSYGDVVLPGAFKRTINNWSKTKRNIPLLWQHKNDCPIGHIVEIREDAKGVWIKAFIVRDEGCDLGKQAYALLKHKSIDGLSFGYDIIDAEPNQFHGLNLKEIRLNEGSVVTFQANKIATVENVKSELESDAVKTALPVHAWKVAPADTAWSGGAAKKRCNAWADGDVAKLKQCFLVYDEDAPESITGYRLGYVDIIDGTPQIVAKAVAAIKGALNGARGTGVDLTDDERDGVETALTKLERRVANAKEDTPMPHTKAASLTGRLAAELAERDLYDERWKLEDAFRSALYEIFNCDDDDVTPESMVEECNTIIDEYAALMKAWCVKRAAIEASEGVKAKDEAFHQLTKAAAPNEARKAMGQAMKAIGKAMGHVQTQLETMGYDCDCDADMMEELDETKAKALADLLSTVDAPFKPLTKTALKAHKELRAAKAAVGCMAESVKATLTEPDLQVPGPLFSPSGTGAAPTGATNTPDPLSLPAAATGDAGTEGTDDESDAVAKLMAQLEATRQAIANVTL